MVRDGMYLREIFLYDVVFEIFKTRFSRFHVLSGTPAVLTLFVIIRLVIVSTNVLIILIKYDTANILCARTLKRSL